MSGVTGYKLSQSQSDKYLLVRLAQFPANSRPAGALLAAPRGTSGSAPPRRAPPGVAPRATWSGVPAQATSNAGASGLAAAVAAAAGYLKLGQRRNPRDRPGAAGEQGGPGAGAPARPLGRRTAIQISSAAARGRFSPDPSSVRDPRLCRPPPQPEEPRPGGAGLPRALLAASAPGIVNPSLRALRSPVPALGDPRCAARAEAPGALRYYYLIAATPIFTHARFLRLFHICCHKTKWLIMYEIETLILIPVFVQLWKVSAGKGFRDGFRDPNSFIL